MEVYNGYPTIQGKTVSQRVELFCLATLDCIQEGASIKQIEDSIPKLIEEQRFELVEGIKKAIKMNEEIIQRRKSKKQNNETKRPKSPSRKHG